MTPAELYDGIGIVFVSLFSMLAVAVLYKIIKVWGELNAMEDLGWIDELLPIERGVTYPQSLIDNRVEQVWLEYETEISSQVASIGGIVNSAILLGFFGTIYGTIFAFQDMTRGLSVQSVQVTTAITQAFEGGLNTALLTSLLSSAMGAIVIFFLAVRTQPRLKAFEREINERISVILENLIEKPTPVSQSMEKVDG